MILIIFKIGEVYMTVFKKCNVFTGKKLDILTMIHDFEDGIIKAVREHFLAKFHSGCYFHWLKALVEMMTKMGFDNDFKWELQKEFKFLTVIERDNIEHGIEYIREKAKKIKGYKGHKKLLDEFLDRYFRDQWMRTGMIALRNFNGTTDWKEKM